MNLNNSNISSKYSDRHVENNNGIIGGSVVTGDTTSNTIYRSAGEVFTPGQRSGKLLSNKVIAALIAAIGAIAVALINAVFK